MDVYVDACGIYVEEKHATREFVGRYVRGVRLLERGTRGAALDVSAVYKEILIISVCPDVIGSADKSLYAYSVDLKLGWDKL